MNEPLTSVVSANPANWTPNVTGGAVRAVAVAGSTVVIGGIFTTVTNAGKGGQAYPRHFIAAFSATTGKVLTSFAPRLDGSVENLEPTPDGRAVIAVGRFKTVNGTPSRGIAKINVPDGTRDASFGARLLNGYALAVAISKDKVYVGGRFDKTSGGARANLAVFALDSGALDTSFNIPVTSPRAGWAALVAVVALSPSTAVPRLLIGGNFTRVAGLDRNQIAMIDPVRGVVTAWATTRFVRTCHPKFYYYLRDIDFSPDGTYFVTAANGGGSRGSLCDAAARFSTLPEKANRQPDWVNSTGGDTLMSVAVTPNAVYVGGHQRWLSNPLGSDSAGPGAIPREGIGALSPKDGSVLPWNPGKARGVGVWDLLVTKQGLWVASDTDRIGHEIHRKIALMPATGS